ncbi:HpcH/HpaI aldolase/citrate lyase family protein [Psychromarinibacter halotolerans]|uniref:HpcH/HpaI aldolase/citrate lyase family protein n=1 Tax=Psychromarinibacter halotolerans TaxID=1775175 RepID=A0ABV7H1X5_9RHOB|nr:CoA ester lyase [Psychromarinibacter halotolerans]MDF0596429.1 CoA ester lyase [Psychromarinibacter halotolerans]
MTEDVRPYRSVLYIPGSKDRALDKVRSLPADAIIFDLEDAVAADEKTNARATLAAALAEGGYGARARIVRVNGLDTDWGREDIAMAAKAKPDAILLPKVGRAADLDAVADLAPGVDLWAMIETPAGILHAEEIAAHPRLTGMVMGTNDLAKELNCRFRADRLPLITSLQIALLAARAHGVVCVDGVYNAFKDEDGLRAECEQGRDMGFDGKSLIHPAQLAVANATFAPSEDEVDLARRQIEAFESAEAEGQGVAVLDGRIVENLHVATARATLARAAAITALELAQ